MKKLRSRRFLTGSEPSPHRWILYVVVLLAATIPYLNSLEGAFTFDDIGVIRDNPTVQSGSVAELATTPEYLGMAYYRPLTLATYAANARLWSSPAGYHAVNLLLHGLVSILVLRLGFVLLQSTFASAAAAILFAVHPVHCEAVSSIVGRAEVLAALLVLIALLGFVRSLEVDGHRRRLWQGLSALTLVLGVLAKESALTAVVLLPVIDLWVRPAATRRMVFGDLAPYAVLALAYLGLRSFLIGSVGVPDTPSLLDNPLAHVATLPRLMTATVVFWEYVSLLAFPVHLAADYGFNQTPVVLSALEPRFVLAAGATTVLFGGTLALSRRAPGFLLAILFFLIPLSVTANVLFPIGTIKAERLLYLPSFGWCLGLGCLAQLAARRHAASCLLACAVLTAVYGARTWVRNRDWRDGLSLFTATVSVSPASAKAHHNLAVNYERRGRLDDALLEYQEALAIFPEYADAAGGIGSVYDLKGNARKALQWYEQATRLDWGSAKAHLRVGIAWQRLGNHDTAEAAFRTGLTDRPEDPYLLLSLGAVRLDQGDFWGAVDALERVGPGTGEVAKTVAAVRREIEERLR